MGFSIQENLKKINSRLSVFDCISVVFTVLLLVFLAFQLHIREESFKQSPVYRISATQNKKEEASLPFGSKNGTTFTYSWCQGSGQIKEENKVYFKSAEQAERSGRTLSKLCQK